MKRGCHQNDRTLADGCSGQVPAAGDPADDELGWVDVEVGGVGGCPHLAVGETVVPLHPHPLP